ncbi:hypothetical protein L3X38_040687 [Prunus dulcis]|uniref:Transposable element protein n=1 Tax=Prunus dulcis TaxID=3755 RepID=A0AAD4YTR0_PRUDU|nr:hypothetical protein L3X38_040687 [Prunus dulcis]
MSDETTSSREKAPRCELKPLPARLKYAFLGEDETYPVVISSKLELLQEGMLLKVLKDHRTAVGWTLSDIKEKILVFNWEKCQFMITFGIVLGYIVSHKGIEVDKSKIDLIANLPIPKTVKEIRSFLGHAGFYRIFIQNFSAIARPLNNLLEQDAKFDWNYACQEAFEKLIKMLTSTLVM